MSIGTVPISSKKIVPPSAALKSPFLSATAPVNEPRTCPKRFDSRRSGGSAPEWTVTNGPAERGDRRWSAFATSSLPVPLSPVTRIVEREAAAWRTVSKTRSIEADRPTSSRKPPGASSFARSARFSATSRRFSSACLTTWTTSSLRNGFGM